MVTVGINSCFLHIRTELTLTQRLKPGPTENPTGVAVLTESRINSLQSISYSKLPTHNRLRLFRLAAVCLVGFVALNGALYWRLHASILAGDADFASFYTAGKIVDSGQGSRLYDPALQWEVQQEFAAKARNRNGPLPYVRPPFEALLFLPLAKLSYPTACTVWLTVKLAVLLAIPSLLRSLNGKKRSPSAHLLGLLVCLAYFPVGLDMIQGQDSILLLLILVLALRLLLSGTDLAFGAMLGLGLFKFHLIIPLFLILALKRRGKFVAGFLASGCALFGISLAVAGASGVVTYPKYLWTLNQLPGLGMIQPRSMPNVRGIVMLLMPDRSLPPAAHWCLLGLVVLGIAIAARGWRGTDRSSVAASFSLAIVIVLVTSYYGNSCDLTLLLLPLLLLGEEMLASQPGGWPSALFSASAAVLLCTPLLWFLILKVNQVCWISLVLVSFGGAIWAMPRDTLSGEDSDRSVARG